MINKLDRRRDLLQHDRRRGKKFKPLVWDTVPEGSTLILDVGLHEFPRKPGGRSLHAKNQFHSSCHFNTDGRTDKAMAVS